MTVSILLIALGLVLLLAGGEALVRGASTIAQLAGVSPSVVGLTVVAAGTSMPELVVSLNAAIAGNADLAVANVVGSNIFNVGAILGVAALIAPLRIQGNSVRLEWPLMLFAACLLYLLARDGSIDRLEGGFLALGLVLFIAYTVKIARTDAAPTEVEQLEATVKKPAEDSRTRPWSRSVLGVLLGCAFLVAGAHCLVVGAVDIASQLGLSTTVIGLTIVAAGTSLPELATSAVASYRGHDDIAVANVIGSNIFNVLGIAGITSLIQPIPVAGQLLSRDMLWMVGFSIILFPLMRTGLRISRLEGALLFAGFAVYMGVLLTG